MKQEQNGKRLLADVVLLSLTGLVTFGLFHYIRQFFAPMDPAFSIDLSLKELPKYTFFSLSRGLIAFVFSVLFSLAWGLWAAKDKVAEKCLIPMLDVLQSIPILGFMPGLILLFISVFPNSNVGLELASILLIFTSQAWNMAFGVYNSIRMIPKDKIECGLSYRFSRWQFLKWVELPSTVITLVWNSILSVAAGWFFLMVSESFSIGTKNFGLPGLGSYMSQAAAEGNITAMFFSMGAMIGLIVFLDQLLWSPLIVWSQKFRLETISAAESPKSWFGKLLQQSYFLNLSKELWRKLESSSRRSKSRINALWISRPMLVFLLIFLAGVLYCLFPLLVSVQAKEWLLLGTLLWKTLARVVFCLLINLLWSLPFGLVVGLFPQFCNKIKPVLQIAASFPATLLFPFLLWLLTTFSIPLQTGTLWLMLLGSGWYILFNIIAGGAAIPTDLKEVAKTFHFSLPLKIKKLYLPAIFPSLVTGLCTAAGGAWNTSIVAEYLSYKGKSFVVPGIGSSITMAATQGNMPLLAASVVVMMGAVALINYVVWLRLYHYAEKRFVLTSQG